MAMHMSVRPAAYAFARPFRVSTMTFATDSCSSKGCSPPPAEKAPKMPSYKSWTLARLQEEAGKYSFRPSSSNKELVARLERVWQAVHGLPKEMRPPSAECPSGTSIRSRATRSKKAYALDEEFSVIWIGSSEDSSSSVEVATAICVGPQATERGVLNEDTTGSDVPLTSTPLRKGRPRKLVSPAIAGDSVQSATSGSTEGKSADKRKPRRQCNDAKTTVATANTTKVTKEKTRAKEHTRGKGRGKVAVEGDAGDPEDDDDFISSPSSADEAEQAEESAAAIAALSATPSSLFGCGTLKSLHLKQAVQDDAQLWRRILLMEPIPLDEFVSIANRPASRGGAGLGIKTVKHRLELRNWLEMQGICTFADELTGNRRTH
ncbi:hypothetical protein K437DRAFT_255058 [Tilletiaria anomala UBC 951]|uniref:Structure-specific endonuclease subunit SLX4 n=1 Tax=Tilletiaria anomala (strain ATCC 24038 / CBS 436.72 / UBC 951) TaxID=1037660 RepID=A0A066WH51_TILAU|nr:uncharacterized protein K437DRAFT_255058 [Tilletiaria anomala UBC 951]KDN50354.1 hypothetical protein K437DRAFT_255058 [Tilletiaria anomala UBC 951]